MQSSPFTLNPDERGIVVFKLLPSLTYGKRMALSFGLIAAGMLTQWLTATVVPGVLPLLLGNLFLLVKGYDNRVDYAAFSTSADWQAVDAARFSDMKKLETRLKRWDRSALDITNRLGFIIFALMSFALLIASDITDGLKNILVVDAALLLLPHWLFGIRRILLLPKLLIKTELLNKLLKIIENSARGDQAEPLMLLEGNGDKRLPKDVKLKVIPKNPHKDFLGLYCQVVVNDVQGRSYPYFYVVLVAREGYGLEQAFERLQLPKGIIKEYTPQQGVEVIVIRQHTTRTSGYHTPDSRVQSIFVQGMRLMHEVGAGMPM